MDKIKILILAVSAIFPSNLRIRLMNLLGCNINLLAKLKLFSVILAKDINIGAFAKIDSFVIIAGLDKLVIQEYSAIQRFTLISGSHSFNIKKRAMVGSRCVINAGAGDVEIGEYSALAPRSSIYTHGTFLPVTHGYKKTNKGIKIGDYCWIMQNTSIGPGVEIESNSIILPGSSVVKNIPDNMVVYSTPVEQKKFPIYFFKKKLDDNELADLIREITVNYLNTLKSDNREFAYSIDKDLINIEYRKYKNYIIQFTDIKPNSPDISDGRTHIFFYYDFDIGLMKSRQYVCYDFKRIINSYPKLPDILTGFDDYAFFNYGLKFMDVNYL
jgi:acetyltransferase-like isoleucine patch superfamily enzyme